MLDAARLWWGAGFQTPSCGHFPRHLSLSPLVVLRVGSFERLGFKPVSSEEARASLLHSSLCPHPQVFFTRNGKIIGKKDAVVPSGGFFPTIGMLSCGEKVKVDLHPLSG